MKNLSLLLVLCLSLSLSAQMPAYAVQVFDGLGMPGSVVVGNVTVAEDRNGTFCALEFDGQLTSLILVQGWEQYMISPDSSLSISLWYQGGSSEAGDLESLIIKYGTGADPHFDPIYGLQLYDLNTPLMVSPEYAVWADQSGIVFPDDPEWHHLVGVFEAGHWKLYMDNVLTGSYEGPEAAVGPGNADLAIGPGFEGKLDDIIFYDRALNSDEVEALFYTSNFCAVGISEEVRELDVNIYPNPGPNQFKIDLKEVDADYLRILDITGKVLMEKVIYTKTIAMDISHLNQQICILEFSNDGKVIGQRRYMKGIGSQN